MDTPDGTRASVSGRSGQKSECRAISTCNGCHEEGGVNG